MAGRTVRCVAFGVALLACSACGARTALHVGGDAGTDASTPDATVPETDAGDAADAGIVPRGRSLAASLQHTCALDSAGGVWCWGAGGVGQLGDGTMMDQPSPVAVIGVTDAVGVAVTGPQSCALEATGQVSCWGTTNIEDPSGGMPTSRVDLRATHDDALSGVVVLDGDPGEDSLCAIDRSGSVRCWGDGENGLFGDVVSDAEYEYEAAPHAIAGVPDAIGVAMAPYSGCSWSRSGIVTCWGWGATNIMGAAATDTTPISVYPATRLVGVDDAVQVEVGWRVTCVRHATGSVSCWGNFEGSRADLPGIPTVIPGVHDAVDIALTPYAGDGPGTLCIAHADGTVGCVGQDAAGERGDGLGGMGGTRMSTDVPIPIDGLTGIVELTAGGRHFCARAASSEIHCWGDNSHGQIGDGTTILRTRPVPVRLGR